MSKHKVRIVGSLLTVAALAVLAAFTAAGAYGGYWVGSGCSPIRLLRVTGDDVIVVVGEPLCCPSWRQWSYRAELPHQGTETFCDGKVVASVVDMVPDQSISLALTLDGEYREITVSRGEPLTLATDSGEYQVTFFETERRTREASSQLVNIARFEIARRR
jgi:hypothetical protein